MEPGNRQMLEIVARRLRPEDVKRSCIYWYKKTLRQGEAVRIGPQTVAMPFEGTVVFVDLAPHANWAHPCLCVLVDAKTLQTEVIDASFPLGVEQSDADYVLLLRFGQPPRHERDFNAFD